MRLKQLSTLLLLLACASAHIERVCAAASDAGSRRLLQTTASRPGPFTDWMLTSCLARCPNLFLASWGFQCALGTDQCCQRKDKYCTQHSLYENEPTPATWTGRDMTGANLSTTTPATPTCPGGGQWQNASGTQYWSYAPCCTDPTADQKECVVYSACDYEGLFAAFGDNKKSLSWVKKNNIAAFFVPPNKQNRKEWSKKWKNKQLLIRNPDTCATMTVTIYDTCDDRNCPDPTGQGPGCCTAHANMNGGILVDLEYYTSVRFWGAPIGVDEVRRLEFQVL